jgi:predicted GH43/DUF377 family glycosyl hydrolase
VASDPVVNSEYDKTSFSQKVYEMGSENDYSIRILAVLPDPFTLEDLRKTIAELSDREPKLSKVNEFSRDNLIWLAQANYEIEFPESLPVSARALFPQSPSERKGIEDARFVRFVNDDGTATYYATYTAWSGRTMLPQMLETKDFLHFCVGTMSGRAVENKGFALFPRKLNGQYVMLSRQDGENIFIMNSDDVRIWREKTPLLRPTYPWEFIKLGNCGSPIEIDEGWLVITHGVGAMRKYCIGAILLDKEDPTKVIGRLKAPLLKPVENEREGYVPNVVYSCGSLIHNGLLFLPYAMSDSASRIATIEIKDLLSHFQ